jgi:hypothetical protein
MCCLIDDDPAASWNVLLTLRPANAKAIETAAATINKLRLADTTVGDYARLYRVAHTVLHDMDANHYHAAEQMQMHHILRGMDTMPEMSAIVLQYSKRRSYQRNGHRDFCPHPTALLLITLPSIKPIAYVPCATVQDILLQTVAPRLFYLKTVASIQQPLTPSVNFATTTGAANVVRDATTKQATALSNARSPATSEAPMLPNLSAYSPE